MQKHLPQPWSKMIGVGLIILAAFCLAFSTGCQAGETMEPISQISYTSQTGSILPELQWTEEFIITPAQVRLTRQGHVAETEVNAGSWEFAVDEAQAAALFAQLEAVDCATMTRIEPDDPPDGGNTESYTLVYTNGQECTLWYDPGTTYEQGELLVTPIMQFIQNIRLPAEAADRY